MMGQKMEIWRGVVLVVVVIALGQVPFFHKELPVCQAEPVLEFEFTDDETPVSSPVALPESSAPLSVLSSSPRAGDVWEEPITGMEFVWVPEGCFMMGSPLTGKTGLLNKKEKPLWYRALAVVSSILPYGCVSSSTNTDRPAKLRSYFNMHGYQEDETPVHEVCLDGFWIGKYEVTQGQWKKIMSSNPSQFKAEDGYPVEQVSWNDAKAYIENLNRQSGHKFSLPTEAQWEYAARSGGKLEKYSGGNDVDAVAWYYKNSGNKTHLIGTRTPNRLGIYDMSGNVWEWCEDVYDKNAYAIHARQNPLVTSGGTSRVRRGGSWIHHPGDVRSTFRGKLSAAVGHDNLGFRLALQKETEPIGSKLGRSSVAQPAQKSCGAYTAPGVWKEFDCYNLAAIGKTTNDDPLTPSWRLIGGYWQWGRKGPSSSQWFNTNTQHFAHGPTSPGSGDANSGKISGWDLSDAPGRAWFDSHKTDNDPCPPGYRVPTKKQWDGVLKNNTQRTVGSWSENSTNYSSAQFFGDKLMLPAAGNRISYSGALSYRGTNGYYWCRSQGSNSSRAWGLYFGMSNANLGNNFRRSGFSVRCITE
jgi:uncharacterized protein (TIGR02145 family)